MVFVVTTRRAPVNSIGCSFDDQFLAKVTLLLIINESGTPFSGVWRLYVESTKNTSSHSQLIYELE